jgi:hypothetical protein
VAGPCGGHAALLDVTPEARWAGDFGLAVVLDDATAAYLETSTPHHETRYVVRFHLNADALALGAAGSVTVFQALSSPPTPILTVRLQSDGGAGRQIVCTVATGLADASTPPVGIGPGWHALDLDWRAAAGPGTNDGALSVRLDGTTAAALAALDNDQSTIALARWGAVEIGSSTTGALWLDDFASRRSGPIGATPAGALDVDGNGSAVALSDGLLVVRWLFGFGGAALTDGAVGGGCTYCTAAAIAPRLDQLDALLDVDGDGSIEALTDGLLVLRFLFGLTGPALVGGAIGEDAARATPEAIAGYLLAIE